MTKKIIKFILLKKKATNNKTLKHLNYEMNPFDQQKIHEKLVNL